MDFMGHNKEENNYYELRIGKNVALPGNIIVTNNNRVLVMQYAPRHQDMCGSRYSEYIVNFSARWVMSFTLRPLYLLNGNPSSPVPMKNVAEWAPQSTHWGK
jgi:hypothetical protein